MALRMQSQLEEAELRGNDPPSPRGMDGPDDEELDLEAQVFGSLGVAKSTLAAAGSNTGEQSEAEEESEEEEEVIAAGFSISRKRTEPVAIAESKAAWVDEDDEEIEVDLTSQNRLRKLRQTQGETVVSGREYMHRLREQHRKLNGGGLGWTRKRRRRVWSEDKAEEESLLRSTQPLVDSAESAFATLPPGRLDISRMNDANQHGVSAAVVQCVDWHKDAMLMLTAGYDKSLRVFHVDGKENRRFHSVYLQDMPIRTARFTGPTHEHIVCAGRRRFMYWVDLETGRVNKVPRIFGCEEKSLETFRVSVDGRTLAIIGNDGRIVLVSNESKRMICSLKMNGSARCAAFSHDNHYLYSSGGNGQVYKWDLRTQRCLQRHVDEGSTGTLALDVTSDGSKYATGLQSGVVNIYDANVAAEEKHPKPLKSIMNLTTQIDDIQFNSDGQLLAFLSRRKRDALKLFSVSSMATVPNWPTAKTPIHYASCVGFSPNSGMLACGNGRGRCLLYRLNHYEAA